MTLDEAILHAEQQAELLEESARGCDLTDKVEREIACKSGKCAAEHRQLAEWLRELKAYKNKYHKYYKPRRTKNETDQRCFLHHPSCASPRCGFRGDRTL